MSDRYEPPLSSAPLCSLQVEGFESHSATCLDVLQVQKVLSEVDQRRGVGGEGYSCADFRFVCRSSREQLITDSHTTLSLHFSLQILPRCICALFAGSQPAQEKKRSNESQAFLITLKDRRFIAAAVRSRIVNTIAIRLQQGASGQDRGRYRDSGRTENRTRQPSVDFVKFEPSVRITM